MRPDLLQLLQGLGSTANLHSIFFRGLELAFSGTAASLTQCLAYLDLMTMAAQTQPRLLELLLKADANGLQALN